jgi:hypothetical protein
VKKLFYRFATSRSGARLLSILAFAALGLYYPTESFAVVYCKDTTPNSPCKRFAGTKCTEPFPVKCSTQGGSSGSGSDWEAFIKLNDQGVAISEAESVCGYGFFDTNEETTDGRVDCIYTPTEGDPIQAQCSFSNLNCFCWKKGACGEDGLRISEMKCGTPADPPIYDIYTGKKLNAAGCTGELTVLDLNGNVIRGPDGSDGGAIQIGEGLFDLNKYTCQDEFQSNGFSQSVLGEITTQCIPAEETIAQERILDQRVRGTDNYQSLTEAFDVFDNATCNPGNLNPNACPNNGGLWIATTLAEGDECVAANYRCGGGDGPPPDRSRIHKGKCEFRCPRCGEDGGSLVNLGSDTGTYVVSSISGNAYQCEVRIVGNGSTK